MSAGSIPFCRVPQYLVGEAGGGLYQWPVGHKLTWTVVRGVPGFSVQDLQQIYQAGWDAWDLACGIEHEYVANPRTANILHGSRSIDQAGGVLAEAELPLPGTRPDAQLRFWLDDSDAWTTADNWQGTGKFPILAVSMNEMGHNLGLGHNGDGLTNALMDPQISHINSLQPWDIEQARLRYGKDVPPDGPPPGNGGEDGELVKILLNCLRALTNEEKEFLRSLAK